MGGALGLQLNRRHLVARVDAAVSTSSVGAFVTPEELDFREQYFRYIREQREAIARIATQKYATPLAKVLWCALLDTLAKARFPKAGNRERFRDFVQHHCGWSDGHRISLPYIHQFGRSRSNDPNLHLLRQFTGSRIRTWHSGVPIPLSHDPEPTEVMPLVSRTDWTMIQKKYSAVGLLYTQRNALVHEFRTKGRSWAFDATEPEYTILMGDEVELSLAWPSEFFARLVESGITNLHAWAIETGANLRRTFPFGMFAYDDLNKVDFYHR